MLHSIVRTIQPSRHGHILIQQGIDHIEPKIEMRQILKVLTLTACCFMPVTSFSVPGASRSVFDKTGLDFQLNFDCRTFLPLKASSSDDDSMERTSFDQAGKDLIEEEDEKRMQAMGDFDSNPDASNDTMEKMRAAIRERTAEMGLEKSKVSADYIASKQQKAVTSGAQAASESNDVFGGLDLSQISTAAKPSSNSQSIWADEDGEVPSMFYEVDDELTADEKAECDPVGEKPVVEQVVSELQNSKWPEPLAALREVGLMVVVVLVTGAIVIGWDKLLRGVFTDVLHFIPSKADLAAYTDRFSGLDLPSGWTDNMNDVDVTEFSDKVSTAIKSSSGMPDL